MPIRLREVVTIWFVAFGLTAAAQTAPPADQPSTPLLRTQTNAVVVDVVVTGKDGKPVPALRQQDFVITENGRPQTIDFFEAHPNPIQPTASTQPTLPPPGPHTYTNQLAAPAGDAIDILLLDSLNTPEADQSWVHKQTLNFVDHMNSNAPVAIFTLNTHLRLLQGFTSDRATLRAALDGKSATPRTTAESRDRQDVLNDDEDVSMQNNARGGKSEAEMLQSYAGNQAANRATDTLAALAQIARALAAVPGRKNLIWFATTFPVSVFPNADREQTLADGRDIPDALRATLNLLTQSRVAIYPVSAQGIMTDTTTNADSAGQPNGDNFERNPLKQTRSNATNRGTMEHLAIDTGGEALYTSNDLSTALSHALEAGAHYYTLVYTPTNSKTDGSFRNIAVKTPAESYKLEYRRGYFADDRSAPSAQAPADPLAPLLAHGLPSSTQIVYQVRALPADPQPAIEAPRAGGNTKLSGNLTRYALDFTIPVANLDLSQQPNGSHSGKVEVALIAHGKNGAAVNWTAGQMNIVLSAASFAAAQKSGIPAHFDLDVPKGALSLSTGVYALASARSGTLEILLPPR